YLFGLAQAFTSFYEACPILKGADEGVRAGRLALASLTAQVLVEGLDALGGSAPQQMCTAVCHPAGPAPFGPSWPNCARSLRNRARSGRQTPTDRVGCFLAWTRASDPYRPRHPVGRVCPDGPDPPRGAARGCRAAPAQHADAVRPPADRGAADRGPADVTHRGADPRRAGLRHARRHPQPAQPRRGPADLGGVLPAGADLLRGDTAAAVEPEPGSDAHRAGDPLR